MTCLLRVFPRSLRLSLIGLAVFASSADANTFSGQAVTARLKFPSLGANDVSLADAGAMEPGGGFTGGGLLSADVPGVFSGSALHAALAGAQYEVEGGRTDSMAGLADVVLLPGHLAQITASFSSRPAGSPPGPIPSSSK